MNRTDNENKGGRGPLIAVLIIAAICLLLSCGMLHAVLRGFWTWRTDRRLMTEGVAVEGNVIDKRVERRSSGDPKAGYQNVYWLHYAFRTKAGHSVDGRRGVPKAVFESYRKGQKVRVRVDANNPKAHVPEFAVVDQELHLGFVGILAFMSFGVSIVIWVLILLYLTGRVDPQWILNLFTADLAGRKPKGASEAEGAAAEIPAETVEELRVMLGTDKRIQAIRLLRDEHNMKLKEAQDFLEDLAKGGS